MCSAGVLPLVLQGQRGAESIQEASCRAGTGVLEEAGREKGLSPVNGSHHGCAVGLRGSGVRERGLSSAPALGQGTGLCFFCLNTGFLLHVDPDYL